MDWSARLIATTFLWGAFCLLAFGAVTAGYAVLSTAGAIDGRAADSFAYAWSIAEYLACGALATASLLVYSGFTRLGRSEAGATPVQAGD